MFLFKLVEVMVDGMISEIEKQSDLIQNMVLSALINLVDEVEDSMWKGEGANRFVQEMKSEVIPSIQYIVAFTYLLAREITDGQNRMREAINQADNKAKMLFGPFSSIF